MSLRTHTLVAIAFAMGAGTTVIVEKLLAPSQGDVTARQSRVEETVTTHASREAGWSMPAIASGNSLDTSSSGGSGVNESDRISNATFDVKCEPSDQWESAVAGSDQDDSFVDEAVVLDPALQEERYASADVAYEREEMRLFQESILAGEEEASLYALPPVNYVISAEEQDALERESVTASIAAGSVAEDEQYQQQVLENETRIDALYKDQREIGSGGNEE